MFPCVFNFDFPFSFCGTAEPRGQTCARFFFFPFPLPLPQHGTRRLAARASRLAEKVAAAAALFPCGCCAGEGWRVVCFGQNTDCGGGGGAAMQTCGVLFLIKPLDQC